MEEGSFAATHHALLNRPQSNGTAGKVIACKAAVLWAAGEPFSIEEVLVDPPQRKEVRIRILYASICHTDLSAWKGENERQRVFPRILGHEAAGVVESVGEGVEDVGEGDHVVPIFTGECGECAQCASERTNLCADYRVNPFKSVMTGDGRTRFSASARGVIGGERRPVYHFLNTSTFAEYTVLDSACVVKINPKAPLQRMCLLSCGISTGMYPISESLLTIQDQTDIPGREIPEKVEVRTKTPMKRNAEKYKRKSKGNQSKTHFQCLTMSIILRLRMSL